jgi:P4 family phage/plasmid primase-like protien
MPATLHIRTGGGGEQFIFAAGNYAIKSMNGYQPNNDLKALGGYVVLPDSLHASGNRYTIIGDVMYPTPLPELLAQKLMMSKSGAVYESTRAPGAPSYIFSEARKFGAKAGYRDEFFNALAFQLKKNNASEKEAFDEVSRVHALTEQPEGDEFTLQEALTKLIRVYRDDSVTPDPIPEWPAGTATINPIEPTTNAAGVLKTASSLLEIMGKDPLTDVGNGQLLSWHIKDRWVFTNDDWYEWENGQWTKDVVNKITQEAEFVAQLLHDFGRDMKNDLEEEDRQRMLSWAHMSHAHVRLQTMIARASAHPDIARDMEAFDQNPGILSARNCTIDLRTGEGYAHRPSDMCMKGTKVDYIPRFQNTTFTKFIQATCANDPEELLYLQRLGGSMLYGETQDKSLYMAIGPRNTGKTTFINLMQTILDSYAMSIDPKYLMRRKMTSIPSYERARMENMRLIVSDEPAAGDFFDESLLKTMTGRGTMTGDYKFKGSRTFPTRFTLFIAGNQAPAVHDEALKARIVEIPFDHQLRYEDQDPEISRAATDPSSDFCKAALAWFVDGCVQWCAYGLAERPMRVVLATEAYLKDQDFVGDFITECLVYDSEERVTMMEVYAAAKSWLATRNAYVLPYRQFLADFKSREGMKVMHGTGSQGWCLIDYKISDSILTWPGQGV